MTELNEFCMGCMYKKGPAERCMNCGWVEGTLPESPQHLYPGTLLHGKYLVGRVLGQGGFGITYLGWDLQLDMKLAIKEYMPRDFVTRNTGQPNITFFTGNVKYLFENGMHKFLEEAKILAKYNNHPGIVSVRDFFTDNGTAYLVMYYLEGIDLKKYMEQFGGRLPFEQALTIMTPVMDALSTVHRDGILHRDISPDNIYITTKGEVKLLDFGAARHAMNDSNKSLSVILKPGYAPEEQYRSKGKQGPWTDIYGTAATFYRVITGQVPPESLDRLEEDTLIPPSQIGVSIPPYAEAALLKALSLKAQDRFHSMEEFYQGLKAPAPIQTTPIYTSQPTHSPEPTPSTNNPDKDRTNIQTSLTPVKKKKTGLIIGLVIGGLLLLFILFIAFIFILGSFAPDNPTPNPKPVNNQGKIDNSVLVSVPRLYNLTEEDAKAAIQKAGLQVGKVVQQKNLITKKGRVFQQSPDPDTKKGKNTPIDIYVNSGVQLPANTNTIHQQGITLINQYWDQADALYNKQQWEQALEIYTQTREMASELYKFNGNNEARIAEGRIANTMSLVKIELGYLYYALEDINESVQILADLQKQNKLTDPLYLGDAYGNLAWNQILNKNAKDSLTSIQQAMAIDPKNQLLQVTLAHAYLLTDNFKGAFKLYRATKDLDYNGQHISDIIADDFTKLEKAGYSKDQMSIINDVLLDRGQGAGNDEQEIKRTISLQTYSELAEDLDGYMSTYLFDPASTDYKTLADNYKNLFATYDFSEANVKEFTIQENTGGKATVLVTKTFKYSDSKQEYTEEVTYKFTLSKTTGSLPWRIIQSQVVKK